MLMRAAYFDTPSDIQGQRVFNRRSSLKGREIIAAVLARLLPVSIMRDKRFFTLWEKRGYHVTPVHFYEPIPDTREFRDDIFTWESELPGIDMNPEGQIALLERLEAQYKEEYDRFPYAPTDRPDEFYFNNTLFESVDAEMLYCMVREFKPRRVIEIGSGFSTRVTAAAIRRNRELDPAYDCELTCVEPNPRPEIQSGLGGMCRLVKSRAQDLSTDFFAVLDENDILFIDSSHVIALGNDVWFEYLEVMPRLRKGVIVHVHDILLPRQYVEHWHRMKMFWNEQYLLQAFLAFNASFEVMWAGNYMHVRHPDMLKRAFASYKPGRLSGHKSFWMRKVV